MKHRRTRRPLFVGAIIVALAVLLSACELFAPPETPDPTPTGTIEGSVVNRKAGTAVSGTTVAVVELPGTQTTTDARGHFSFEVPEGAWTVEFTQTGYATSRVAGVVVSEDDTTHQSVIQSAAFDPAAPTLAPSVTISVADGDTVTVDPDTDSFSFDIEVAVENPELVRPYFVTAGLGQSRGTSGYLNRFVPGQVVGTGQAHATASLSADGFDGETTLHVVAYDTNFNRTEVIVSVVVNSIRDGATPVAPTSLVGNAITFNDVGVFGALGVPPQVSGQQLVAAMAADDLTAFAPTATSVPTAYSEIQPSEGLAAQSGLDEVVTWVDLYFDYAFSTAADLPTAFEVFRQLGAGEWVSIGRVSPFLAYLGGATFGFRDATPAISAGVEATYRVDAVTGSDRQSSETFSVTPLGAFNVTADAPANGEDFTSVVPTYDMSYTGTADEVFIGVLVFDRVHAGENFLEWGVVGLDTSVDGVAGITLTDTSASIPHNVDGTASTAVLQSFHTYDWTPIAVTYTTDFGAISVAADFYDFFGIGFGVSDGPWNTFLTGDGSF